MIFKILHVMYNKTIEFFTSNGNNMSANINRSCELVVTIKNEQPIYLSDLTDMMQALADEYKYFLTQKDSNIEIENTKLFIRTVREGSIEIMLLGQYIPPVMELFSTSNTLLDFFKHLGGLFLQSQKTELIEDKRSLQNVNTITNSMSNSGSGIHFNFIGDNNIFHLENLEALAIDKNQTRQIAEASQKQLDKIAYNEKAQVKHSEEFENVLLIWDVAKNTNETSKKDKVIIESIASSPVQVQWENESDKVSVLKDEGNNPFNNVYLVDVEAIYHNNKPKFYLVKKIKGIEVKE